jgi:hypothetical protein
MFFFFWKPCFNKSWDVGSLDKTSIDEDFLLGFKVSSVEESFKEDDDELVLRAQGEWKDGVK